MEVSRMNYWFTAILIVLICLLTLIEPAYPGSAQTNTSGSTQRLKVGTHLQQLQPISLDQVLIVQQIVLLTLILNQRHHRHLHHHTIV